MKPTTLRTVQERAPASPWTTTVCCRPGMSSKAWSETASEQTSTNLWGTSATVWSSQWGHALKLRHESCFLWMCFCWRCSWIQESQSLLSERGYESASKVWSGREMVDIFHNLGITNATFNILKVVRGLPPPSDAGWDDALSEVKC